MPPKKLVEAFCSKDGFKRYCEKYDIQDIPGIYITKDSEIKKPQNISYPLMVKPVDSGGGVGMKICRDDEDYNATVANCIKIFKKRSGFS